MPEQETANQAADRVADRVAISPSGGGVGIWVGDQLRLRLDWDQARQLQVLLNDALPEARR